MVAEVPLARPHRRPQDDAAQYFHVNPHHQRSYAELTALIREVAVETRKRTWLRNDTEDQRAREFYLRDARNRLN